MAQWSVSLGRTLPMCVKQTLIMPGATDGWPVCMLIICPGLRYKILHFLASSLGFMKILLYFWSEAKKNSGLGVCFLILDPALPCLWILCHFYIFAFTPAAPPFESNVLARIGLALLHCSTRSRH